VVLEVDLDDGAEPSKTGLDARVRCTRGECSCEAVHRRAYTQLLVEQLSARSLGAQIAALDVIRLGGCVSKQIHGLMSEFSEIVAQGDLLQPARVECGSDELFIDDPVSEWAVLICLWLRCPMPTQSTLRRCRRVAQVCTALDGSMHTTYAQNVLKHACAQLKSATLRQHR